MDIMILKTNIRYRKQVKAVGDRLNRQPGVQRWNIDLHDVDKVLRIECGELALNQIINLVNEAGFECEELAD